ncbi:MAG: hypothetical protein M0P01_12360 [Treponema sp.]|nr:hypothetical protein [Treponema sp.]
MKRKNIILLIIVITCLGLCGCSDTAGTSMYITCFIMVPGKYNKGICQIFREDVCLEKNKKLLLPSDIDFVNSESVLHDWFKFDLYGTKIESEWNSAVEDKYNIYYLSTRDFSFSAGENYILAVACSFNDKQNDTIYFQKSIMFDSPLSQGRHRVETVLTDTTEKITGIIVINYTFYQSL